MIYDGCFKYVTADVFEPAEENNDITDIIEYMKEIISEWENKDEVQSQM